MANLIITVIAIALVAIASLMGAYYGGSAFLNNQSAANASTVLNQGQQLAGAWNAYLSDNLNSPPATLTALVTGNYLSSIPTSPAGANSAAAQLATVGTVGGHYYMWANMGVPGATPATTDANFTACGRIIKTATGAAATTIGTLGPGSIANTSTNGNNTFGCAYSSGATPTPLAGAGALIPTHQYVMEYLLQ
jgi:hypothetical protein